MEYSFEKDFKTNGILYAGGLAILVGFFISYPTFFATSSRNNALTQQAKASSDWACAAIKNGAPLLTNQWDQPIPLTDQTLYYGAGSVPIPVGTTVRDALGNAGQTIYNDDGAPAMKKIGSCPGLARTKAPVNTMGNLIQ